MELTKINNSQWKPGQSENLQSADRLEAAISSRLHSWPDLAAVGIEFGTETMIATAKASPKTFFAVCSKLIPKDVELTVRQHYSFDLDPADLEVLKAIREALPDANQRKPGEVFGVVLAALRAHNALLTVMRQSSHKSC